MTTFSNNLNGPVTTTASVNVFNVGTPTLTLGPPFETTDAPVVVPAQDTFRGGALVVWSVAQLTRLDTSRDVSLLARDLPVGWVVGGTTPVPSLRGVVTAGTSSLTTPDSDYVNFDVAIDVELRQPVSAPPGRVDIARLEQVITMTGDVVRVALVRGVLPDPAAVYAIGELNTDPTGGVVRVADTSGALTLRLVRDRARVYGFVGRRNPQTRGADDYTDLTRLLDHDVGTTGAGPLTFGSAGANAEARWSNYTVRSHAAIGGVLIDNKVHRRDGQIIGSVPAATIYDVGVTDVSLFGLSGSGTDEFGFEYILPAPRTVGTEVVRTLRFYGDPFVKDD